MYASMHQAVLRPRQQQQRTEPRILLQMQADSNDNAKLKPTVFLPGAIPATLDGVRFDLSGRGRSE